MISSILMAGIEQAAVFIVIDSMFGNSQKKGIGKKISIINILIRWIKKEIYGSGKHMYTSKTNNQK